MNQTSDENGIKLFCMRHKFVFKSFTKFLSLIDFQIFWNIFREGLLKTSENE